MTCISAVPTAPHRLPLLGHAVEFLREPVDFMESLALAGPLVRICFGSRSFYYVSDPALIHEVLLVQNEAFVKGSLFEKIRPLVGDSIALACGEEHRVQRRMLTPVFQPVRLPDYLPAVEKHARRDAEAWEPGQQVRVDKAVLGFVCRVTVDALFPTQQRPDLALRMQELVPVVLDGLMRYVVLPDAFVRLPLRSHRRFTAACAALRSIIEDMIRSYRSETHGPSEQFDLLSYMLDYRVPESGDEVAGSVIRDEAIAFLVAAQDTTACTLTNVFWILGRHPDLRERLLQEIEAVAQGPITWDVLARMDFTRALIKEVLRLYSPVWFLPRRSMSPVRLGEVVVPAGSELVICPKAVHRNPENFPRSHVFHPDRWLNGSTKDLPKGAYLPFGAGPHVCLGAAFAEAQIMTYLVAVCRRWNLSQTPVQPDRFRYSLTAKLPKLVCRVRPR